MSSTESTFYASWATDVFGLFSTKNEKALQAKYGVDFSNMVNSCSLILGILGDY